MRVLLVGAGAVGTLLGWALARAGHEVQVVRRGLAASRTGELAVIDLAGARQVAAVTEVPTPAALPQPPDLVLLAVKQPALPAAVSALPAWPGAVLLTIQNGIGAEAVVRAARPGAPLLAGSVVAAVGREPDGSVRWLRRGGLGLATVAGSAAPPVEVLAALEAAFAGAGLPTRRYPDAAAMKWSKLVANLIGNATSALLDAEVSAVYADPALFRLERAQVREALAVMAAAGLRPVALPGAPVPQLARGMRLPAALAQPLMRRFVGGARGGKPPSLRLHLLAGGGPSEVAWLNGAVAAEGARLGVPTPVNAALARLVDEAAADPARWAQLRGHPERLLARVQGAG